MPELIEFLKGNSDRTICATQGNGTTSQLSAVIFGGPVDKTSIYMRDEVDRWAAVIKSANIELQ